MTPVEEAMASIAELRALLTQAFTDDPVNWLKWIAVFSTLVLGYVIFIPIYGKVSYRISWERKRDIARERGHVVESRLVKQFPSGDPGDYTWHGHYRYTVNGKEKLYRALFLNGQRPPRVLYLYYLTNPKRLFSVSEYHWENHKAVILLPIVFGPWLLAALAMVLLKAEYYG